MRKEHRGKRSMRGDLENSGLRPGKRETGGFDRNPIGKNILSNFPKKEGVTLGRVGSTGRPYNTLFKHQRGGSLGLRL